MSWHHTLVREVTQFQTVQVRLNCWQNLNIQNPFSRNMMLINLSNKDISLNQIWLLRRVLILVRIQVILTVLFNWLIEKALKVNWIPLWRNWMILLRVIACCFIRDWIWSRMKSNRKLDQMDLYREIILELMAMGFRWNIWRKLAKPKWLRLLVKRHLVRRKVLKLEDQR